MPLLDLEWHKRRDVAASVLRPYVNLVRLLVVLLLRPRPESCLKFSNSRELSVDLDRDELFSIEVNADTLRWSDQSGDSGLLLEGVAA